MLMYIEDTKAHISEKYFHINNILFNLSYHILISYKYIKKIQQVYIVLLFIDTFLIQIYTQY